MDHSECHRKLKLLLICYLYTIKDPMQLKHAYLEVEKVKIQVLNFKGLLEKFQSFHLLINYTLKEPYKKCLILPVKIDY